MAISLKEYIQYDATGLAELVKSKEVQASELLEAALSLMDIVNPSLNAVITPMVDEARTQLKQLDTTAPFAGVPFLLKDLLCAYAGVPMSSGSAAMKYWKPDYHSYLTEKYLKAGFVIFGKTNTPECGLLAVSEPTAFAPARNPWNIKMSPGGSSGGASAAVAARIVPVASAGDGGGSIRIPAGVCGLFGLKPSRGRVSNGPACGESWGGAVAQHVVSRSVRDSARILDCVEGYCPGDPYTAPAHAQSFGSAVAEAPKRLRIAVSSKRPLGLPIDIDCERALDETVRKLLALGHDVEMAEPSIDGEDVLDAYLTLYFGAVSAETNQWQALLGGVDISESIEPATLLVKRVGQRLPVSIAEESKLRWHAFTLKMALFLEKYDLFLLPTTAQAYWPVGSMKLTAFEDWGIRFLDRMKAAKYLSKNLVKKRTKGFFSKVPFTQLANLTGQPSMSIPMHWTASGFPVGSQFIAPYGEERRLISLASQIEEAYPWDQHLPNMIRML